MRNGCLISIIPLISAIVMGISTLASAPGITASVILPNKQAYEQERNNKQIKQITAQGRELKYKYIPDIDNDVIKNDNGITIDPKLAAIIISVVPTAIKVIPSVVKTIKNLHNGVGINTCETTVLSDSALPVEKTMFDRAVPVKRTMSDDELTLNAINFLREIGFTIYI